MGYWQTGKCMVCASFTEEQKQKIINRKRYVKKDKAGVSDVSKDESELLGEPDQGDIFEGSQHGNDNWVTGKLENVWCVLRLLKNKSKRL